MLRGDLTFQTALKAKRGVLTLPPALEPVAEQIELRYGVRPLWLQTDTIPAAGSPRRVRPRLDVVFERTAQFKRFESSPYAFDTKRQAAIAKDFIDLVSSSVRTRIFRAPRGKDLAGELFVSFSAFEPAALEEAHQRVTMSEIDALGHRFFGDSYWQASRLFAAPVIFLHTKAQVDSHGGSPILGQLDDAYRDLVAAQDEFGYFDRSATFVPLDSRENFEANFDSNWYHYWK